MLFKLFFCEVEDAGAWLDGQLDVVSWNLAHELPLPHIASVGKIIFIIWCLHFNPPSQNKVEFIITLYPAPIVEAFEPK